ncbi:hypothetical protein OG897_25005 [Streptomyces sp. NBC_00237]|uniref:hypothetical protein n=1 Tax=Streptomyces sp. NBC_00237 TaxID=2975687 RepID=UPI002254D9FD|nr:hypothetical protein [Streptomyces sp. NBC_00237]MCX5204701.1 hypothetical protein [Streptomyces sp. NBC_00237]
MPALLLLPVVPIMIFTDLGTGWLVASWALWGIALVLGAAQWSLTSRNGLDGWIARVGIVVFHVLLPVVAWLLFTA